MKIDFDLSAKAQIKLSVMMYSEISKAIKAAKNKDERALNIEMLTEFVEFYSATFSISSKFLKEELDDLIIEIEKDN
ncbi:MAG: hypothetical protein RR620_12055 [Clostridium sp.]